VPDGLDTQEDQVRRAGEPDDRKYRHGALYDRADSERDGDHLHVDAGLAADDRSDAGQPPS